MTHNFKNTVLEMFRNTGNYSLEFFLLSNIDKLVMMYTNFKPPSQKRQRDLNQVIALASKYHRIKGQSP